MLSVQTYNRCIHAELSQRSRTGDLCFNRLVDGKHRNGQIQSAETAADGCEYLFALVTHRSLRCIASVQLQDKAPVIPSGIVDGSQVRCAKEYNTGRHITDSGVLVMSNDESLLKYDTTEPVADEIERTSLSLERPGLPDVVQKVAPKGKQLMPDLSIADTVRLDIVGEEEHPSVLIGRCQQELQPGTALGVALGALLRPKARHHHDTGELVEA